MYRIDLNCDFGENFGRYTIPTDLKIMDYVTSINIACGFHAGDPTVMREMVAIAQEKGVAIGAHPGLPDLVGFGRRNMDILPQEAYDMVVYQIGALEGFCKTQGAVMRHVKPHGALYNMASKNKDLAEAIAKAVYDVNPKLILFGLSGGELVQAGKTVGLQTASEVFADRTYQDNGTLTPRRQSDALIVEEFTAAKQVVRMVKEGVVHSQQGSDVQIEADTVCLHGDGEHALEFAKTIRGVLEQEGISVQAIQSR